jgi:ABC-type transport system involved in multi-copper enzyme maturation permease subunit
VVVAGFALRESVRRRVFVVVALLTVAFLALYGLGVWQIAKQADAISGVNGVDGETVAGATMLGLSMFATLFLGAILAVFLTLGAVRGDAERVLLQPIIVRPITRATFLAGRFAAAGSVCAVYVIVVFLASVVITRVFIDWWPDRLAAPAIEMGAAVIVLAALALAGSVALSATANGIAIFMLFGAGLTAGLLGQIAEALSSHTLQDVSRVASWVLPFEALYQSGLNHITVDTFGFTRFAIDLGPFGGAESFGGLLWPYTVIYLAAVGSTAVWGFRRRDL